MEWKLFFILLYLRAFLLKIYTNDIHPFLLSKLLYVFCPVFYNPPWWFWSVSVLQDFFVLIFNFCKRESMHRNNGDFRTFDMRPKNFMAFETSLCEHKSFFNAIQVYFPVRALFLRKFNFSFKLLCRVWCTNLPGRYFRIFHFSPDNVKS